MKRIVCMILMGVLYLSVFSGCNKPNDFQGVEDSIYEVIEVAYESGMYSFTITAGENSPLYAITEELQLSSQKEYGEADRWTELGKLEKTELTKITFDNLFVSDGWNKGQSASEIRKDNANTWQLIYNQEHLYYVLQQKNGDLYLAYGYYDYAEKDDIHSDDTHIRWLFKLQAEIAKNNN